MFFQVVLGLLIAYGSWTLACLEINMRVASRMGIPCVRLPIDSHNILWQVFGHLIWSVLDSLPFDWTSYPASIRHLRRGWHFHEKSSDHDRLGPIWALVSPVRIDVHISDPEAIGHIFAHRRDFVRPIEGYKILEVFGPCISTADVENWPRHRKALAAPFNESIMSFVWDESLRQSQGMLKSWTRPSTERTGIPSIQRDTRSLSLNILAATGFRKTYRFIGSADDSVVGTGTYRDALQTILDNVILLMLLPYQVLMFPLMPRRLARIGQAGSLFKKYMNEMLHEELRAHELNKSGSGGLMTSLIHAHHANQSNNDRAEDPAGRLPRGLSVDEIFGNIFVINFAGHDTTANTLAFAMLLLATQPEVQDWIWEEIREVFTTSTIELGSYKKFFPQLLRCKAILYETLRLYPPIMALPKGTDDRSQSLNVRGKHIIIPPHTTTTMSLLACHTNSSSWSDPLLWKPSRWIEASTEGQKFHTPARNTFFPWSDGPQDCPGKKFAEVEFVAVMAHLFRDHRLEPRAADGEIALDTLKRLRRTINDVDMEMLLRMKNADAVRLMCVAR
ncbi:putative cytochrome P450 monooxygenase [Pseudovirgaria hyperparasitica]|uniref:Putative cytochrome P450 monooxygenase n=1 Tax=Pseudovirgaria hyperparasitica TaxID=470096 RepID=A0A6A6W0L4_9PEZI|nr:putative cytochrome P450 monooxygenase [Pseudovirgaria hyperparasitica]KAF2756458.1 putative cytochrome P450 monooxygenase [Pseudovirgaria hyperparasitica]